MSDTKEKWNEYFRRAFEIISSDDLKMIDLLQYQIQKIFQLTYKELNKLYFINKYNLLIADLFRDAIVHEVDFKNSLILKNEITISLFILKNHPNYVEEREKAKIELQLIQLFFAIDYLREEFTQQNLNQGRTALVTLKLTQIKEHFDAMQELMEQLIVDIPEQKREKNRKKYEIKSIQI